MLSAASRPYIEASVPVLREHGLAITRTFYNNMFAAHPELKNLFNMGNQANGAQQQSLASAVFAYAANIDNAAALAPVVNRIVHKHAAVGITATHYPIVGRHLLGAIKEVLGEAAAPELLAAWDEAYGLLANALIAAEAELYRQSGRDAGVLQPMRVVSREQQSKNTIALTLQPTDGSAAPAFKSGQYISVEARLPNGLRQLRQYSLSDAEGLSTWRISVKRESVDAQTPAGMVSNWLHERIQSGDTLMTSAPFGDFTPDVRSAKPLALLSAGVGITPMLSILNTLVKVNPSRPVLFAHAARDGEHHPHRRELFAAREYMKHLRLAVFYEAPLGKDREGIDYDAAGRMSLDAATLQPFLQGDFLLCGPQGFMQAQWRALLALGVSPRQIQREVFGPDLFDHLL